MSLVLLCLRNSEVVCSYPCHLYAPVTHRPATLSLFDHAHPFVHRRTGQIMFPWKVPTSVIVGNYTVKVTSPISGPAVNFGLSDVFQVGGGVPVPS